MISGLYSLFQQLGMKKNEVDVYLTCISSPRGLQVFEIVKQTQFKRSTINLILERLEERGFVSAHTEGQRRVFVAEPPEHILYSVQQLADEFKSVVPLLRSQQKENAPSVVRFFQGSDDMRRILNDIILSTQFLPEGAKREVLSIAPAKEVFQVWPDLRKIYIEKRVKERIPSRWIGIYNPLLDDLIESSPKQYRKMKFVDQKSYPLYLQMEITIYADKVALMALDKDIPTAVIIENTNMAESFRSLFNFFWQLLPEHTRNI